MRIAGVCLLGSLCLPFLWAQQGPMIVHRVNPGQMYYRVYARVPLIGTGKKGDLTRPMFAPRLSEMKKDHTGILGYSMQLSDDGKWALVEFVGATRQDLLEIINSTDPGVKVFERGKSSKDDILNEFRKYKKDFNFSLYGVRPQ